MRIFRDSIPNKHYPVGTILQPVPLEAMVKHPRETFPKTTTGTKIRDRGDSALQQADTRCAKKQTPYARRSYMPPKKPTVYEFIPKLGQLRDNVLFGDVWEHPDLSKRDRSLITVAMLAALYRTDEMRGHMQRALDNGVTETQLKGLITHVAFYAGWPCAVNAGRIAIDVFGPK